MRRALVWLLPGHSACGAHWSHSPGAAAWLQYLADATASAAGTAGSAGSSGSSFATLASSQCDAAEPLSAQSLQPGQEPGPGPLPWTELGPGLRADGGWSSALHQPGCGGAADWPAARGSSAVHEGLWRHAPASSPPQHLPHPPDTVGAAEATAESPAPSSASASSACDAAADILSPSLLPPPLPGCPPLHLPAAGEPWPPPPPHALPLEALLLPTSSASATTTATTITAAAAFAATEPSALMSVVQQVALSYDYVHAATGLPWAASIPLTTLALRLALLPLSWRQARIIRTNVSLFREALALTDRQERQREQLQQQRQEEQEREAEAAWERERGERGELARAASARTGCGGEATASTSSTVTAATPPAVPGPVGPASRQPGDGTGSEAQSQPQSLSSRAQYSQAVLANFALLRRQCDAPHPAWLAVNPLVQIPVFVLASTTLGAMCRAPWPGLSSEGALWFPDLTRPALLPGPEGWEMPLGPAGLALPLIVYGMTMTTLRLGLGATSGLAAAAAAQQQAGQALGQPAAAAAAGGWGLGDTALGALLRSLPPLLYAATTANLYFQVQMAHGVLLHWLGSAGFTLSLQLALRSPAVRALLKLNRPAATAATAAAAGPSTSAGSAAAASVNSSAADGSSGGGSGSGSHGSPSAGGAAGTVEELPAELVARVAETSDPNILVIMGAQLSARHHYAGALHCFRRAVALNPAHVRAHYSMGQVHSLTGSWPDAELSYRAAAGAAAPGPERGQALYCVATALHAQGKLLAAADAYGEADANWLGQTVIAYSRANALAAAGRFREAAEALAEAEARDDLAPGRPFRQALRRLREQLGRAAGAVEPGADGGGSGGDGAGKGEVVR